jgi:hypothetical protein
MDKKLAAQRIISLASAWANSDIFDLRYKSFDKGLKDLAKFSRSNKGRVKRIKNKKRK